MWKNKKFIVIAVIVAVVLVGTITGVALAQTKSTTTPNSGTSFAARVAAILGIDQKKVEDAFAKAKRDMADESLSSKLDALVKSGKITQQQADQYKKWWESRPQDMPGLGLKGNIGEHRSGGRMMWPKLQPTPTTPAQ